MRASWLIPVRDGAPWLRAAVDSALAQSDADDELLVVDDGSAADPRPLLPRDRRVRLLSQPPLGIVAALERGRAAARGAFIARLDADDLALPGRLDAQVAALAADARLGAIGGRARVLGPSGEGMRRYVEWVNGVRDPAVEILVESPMFHPATTFRAEALRAVGGWRHGDFPEDYELLLRLSRSGWRLANLDAEVLAWRDRPDRLTRVDPRYRRRAFAPLKREQLRATRLREPATVVAWGAGKEGGPWIRWLLDQGHRVPLAIDIKPRGSRHGVPVLPPASLAGAAFDLLLVAVGARGARDLVRGEIARLRPELVEGRDWLAVA